MPKETQMSNSSDFVVVLSDGETFGSLKGATIYKLKDGDRDADTVEATLRTSADKDAETPDDEEGNVEQVWLGQEIATALCPPPEKEKAPSFFDPPFRAGTPHQGLWLRTGAVVLLVKPLPKEEGMCHGSIVLCRFGTEYVTWHYNEDAGGCDHGHYFRAEQLQEAFADWCRRV